MRLAVARIGKAHGIRGEVTVEVRTDRPRERFVPGARFTVVPPSGATGLPRTLLLESVRDHNGVLLLAFDGVLDRSAAEALRGARLETDVDDEPAEPDAWYEHQLVGLRAEAPDGTELGTVVGLDHLPAHDLLVVRRPDGARRLVPFVHQIVPEVDPGRGVVVVDAPPGLLDDLPDDVDDDGAVDDGTDARPAGD